MKKLKYLEKYPRIKIEASEVFIVEVLKDGISIAEVFIGVEQLTFNPIDGTSRVKISASNAHPMTGDYPLTEFTHTI